MSQGSTGELRSFFETGGPNGGGVIVSALMSKMKAWSPKVLQKIDGPKGVQKMISTPLGCLGTFLLGDRINGELDQWV